MIKIDQFWFEELWPLHTACLFWCGFPVHWTLDDLINPDKHDSDLKASRKLIAKINRTLSIYRDFQNAIKIGRVIAYYNESGGDGYCLCITPVQFVKFAVAQNRMPVKQAIKHAPLWALELFGRRPTPLLAQTLSNHKQRSQRLSTKHREMYLERAEKLVEDTRAKTGRTLTNEEIYKTLSVAFRDKNDACVSYSKRTILRKWLPRIDTRRRKKRGRPPQQ